ncbi:hypothetical protein QO002_005923 [Pararhizobium capsulatum DSM 1112]|uniref:Uncharacterized protein n=1 Tax=Pararhizobium capsulatum DSM 1112 TaxID=1121113 RepID=A0ABU0BZM5_9HYPH|nr:hypothetical protein [Pararhizobium capsulatum]MDQ0323716.1 hypothetical protein [Pararhizobium capsulatum DSM 1112]
METDIEPIGTPNAVPSTFSCSRRHGGFGCADIRPTTASSLEFGPAMTGQPSMQGVSHYLAFLIRRAARSLENLKSAMAHWDSLDETAAASTNASQHASSLNTVVQP